MSPKEYAKSLRLIAEWYENQPEETPVPTTEIYATTWWEDDKVQLLKALAVSKQLGDCKKRYTASSFYVERKFGAITLSFGFERNAVCTRRVVGTKEIPEHVIPARTEEIVEWDCHPLLARKEELNESNR